MSLTALMERVHSDGAIPSESNIFLLMIFQGNLDFIFFFEFLGTINYINLIQEI